MPNSLKTLILAVQFLTRLPTPTIKDFQPELLTQATRWFPLVGLLIGGLLFLTAQLSHIIHPLLATLFTLVLWVWITGGLHLDGLADLADGLGAAHRSPERFLAALKDPHLGSFGVITLVMQILSKAIGIYLLISLNQSITLVLIPAFSRLGPLYWGKTLPPLGGGMAEQFAWQITSLQIVAWIVLLSGLSTYLTPWLLLPALAALPVWQSFLHRKVGGVTGDCLGAGIEISESLQLLTLSLLIQTLPH